MEDGPRAQGGGEVKYTCELCKRELESGNDETAKQEAKNIWGVENAAQDSRMVIVCDDCFQQIHPAKFPTLRDRVIFELKKGNDKVTRE